MQEKTGIIGIVATTGGIKFKDEDDWWNPIPAAKKFVTKDLMGQERSIKITDEEKRIFSYIGPPGSIKTSSTYAQPVQVASDSKDDYWKNKELKDLDNSRRISRHGALNTAIEIISLSLKYGSADFTDAQHKAAYTTDNLLSAAEMLAEDILGFVAKK